MVMVTGRNQEQSQEGNQEAKPPWLAKVERQNFGKLPTMES